MKDLILKSDFETLYNHDQVSLNMSSDLLPGIGSSMWFCVLCNTVLFQLKRQMDEEAVFVGFLEGDIAFQPTYKYDTGSDQWDTR